MMFTLHQRDELVFGTPIISEADKIPDDLISDHTLVDNGINNFSNNCKHGEGQKQIGVKVERRSSINRKEIHRDNERKRRQEMSKLYSCLQSILPSEYTQGKHTTCDYMLEAVNHIKHLQNSIQELKVRKDKLKKLLVKKAASSNGSITVNLIRDGVEILISSSTEKTEFELSGVLAELLERNLSVISSVSTKMEGRFLHRIQTEVTDMKSLDLAALQNRLASIID